MKISAVSMEATLQDFYVLQYPKNFCSLLESFLVSKWLEAHACYGQTGGIQIDDANEAVNSLFVLAPENTLGRLYPFRYDWKRPDASGRKTVWNATTRSADTLARTLFQVGGPDERSDIRNRLVADAAQHIRSEIEQYNMHHSGQRHLHLPKKQALVCLVLRDHIFAENSTWEEAESELLTQLAMTPQELNLICADQPLGTELFTDVEWTVDEISSQFAPPHAVSLHSQPQSVAESPESSDKPIVAMDRRLQRMLRRAVTNYPFVLLVGPPGTGKGTMIQWIMTEVERNPQDFGFEHTLAPNAIWATPDESWSAFELIGGFAPDRSGNLTWSPGVIVNAISDQRWLVLDETNRADMDRVMGPLLTWLAGQEVEIGRMGAHDRTAISLGWAAGATNQRQEPTAGRDSVRYLAGRDWRMLGTYNPQDALRVFRFGLALSRRFVVVPVPIPSVGQFEDLLARTRPSAADDLAASIVSLYSAHRSAPDTSLGPAVFLRIVDYVESSYTEDGEETLAEAYVLSIGKYLSSYDDAVFADLQARVIDDEGALSAEQWRWIAAQRDHLS